MIEQVAKAYLVEIENYTTDVSQKEAGSNKFEVHFNPQTLKVAFANQNSGGEQPNGASTQNTGNLTSKLSVELLFDKTEVGSDIREETQKIAKFIMPKDGDTNNPPPRTRFQWGSFIFEGIVDSMNETLEYFSAEGMPLRASVSLSMKSDNIVFLIDKIQGNGRPNPSTPGTGATAPLSQARPGDTVQHLAGRSGQSGDWKKIAAANGIDDPLRPAAGSLLNLNT